VGVVKVRVDLPDLPLKYGPDTTSRSEVIEFTVNDFFGENLGNSPPLSPPLVVFSNLSAKLPIAHIGLPTLIININ